MLNNKISFLRSDPVFLTNQNPVFSRGLDPDPGQPNPYPQPQFETILWHIFIQSQ